MQMLTKGNLIFSLMSKERELDNNKRVKGGE